MTFGDNHKRGSRDNQRYPLRRRQDDKDDNESSDENNKITKRYKQKGDLPSLQEESSNAYTYDTREEMDEDDLSDRSSDDETVYLKNKSRKEKEKKKFMGKQTQRIEFSNVETTFDESSYSQQQSQNTKKTKSSRSGADGQS